MVATVDFVTTMVHTLANQPTGALLHDFNWCQYSGPVHVLVKPTSPEGYGQVTAVVYAAGGVVVEGWVLTSYGPSCSVADLVRLVRDVTNYAHAANGYYADFTYATGNGVPLDFSLTKVHTVIWRAS